MKTQALIVRSTMKLTLQHRNLPSIHELDSLIEDGILALQSRLQIDEASVRLEHHWESSPAYQVRVHLVTPGPDVLAQGQDHTIRAAITKALAELQRKVVNRADQQPRRARESSRELTGPRRPRALRRRPSIRP